MNPISFLDRHDTYKEIMEDLRSKVTVLGAFGDRKKMYDIDGERFGKSVRKVVKKIKKISGIKELEPIKKLSGGGRWNIEY